MNGTTRMSEIRTSEIRTKFHSVFQTERSDFGHLLYFEDQNGDIVSRETKKYCVHVPQVQLQSRYGPEDEIKIIFHYTMLIFIHTKMSLTYIRTTVDVRKPEFSAFWTFES